MRSIKLILGLGTNQGDRLENLRKALWHLRSSPLALELLCISPLYESKAMLPGNAPLSWDQPFLNLAILVNFKTSLSSLVVAHSLLNDLKEIELKLGRKASGKWAPRVIDIDILAMGQEHIKNEKIEIPHPGLLERPFALLPLADIAPEWEFPPVPPWNQKIATELCSAWQYQKFFTLPLETHLSLDMLTQWVGILNITPDSFSDGGSYLDPHLAYQHAMQLIEEGAQILDIGSESTRPGAQPLSPDTEWKRLEPILERLSPLQKKNRIKISIDTRHSWVCEQAIRAGVNWINDVSGFENPKMVQTIYNFSGELVIMHSLTVPADPSIVLPERENPMEILLKWGQKKIKELEKQGINRERIILDPGIGFGKTTEQSIFILKNIHRLHQLGVRILVGHSRKSFLKLWTQEPPQNRDMETAWISSFLVKKGVDFLRVHHPSSSLRSSRTAAFML